MVYSCVAQLSWSTPGNIDIKDISHYEVKFRRVPIANGTSDANEDLSAVNSGCNCNSAYEFSVYAVNRCGRPGASNTTILGPPKSPHTCLFVIHEQHFPVMLILLIQELQVL